MDERCILCGNKVPEGWMICPECALKQKEAGVSDRMPHSEDMPINENEENENREVDD